MLDVLREEDLTRVSGAPPGLLSKGGAVDGTLPELRMSDGCWWESWETGRRSPGPRGEAEGGDKRLPQLEMGSVCVCVVFFLFYFGVGGD